MNKYLKLAIAIVFAFILIFWIKSLIQEHKLKKKQAEIETSSTSSKKAKPATAPAQWHLDESKTVTVYFTDKYDKIIYSVKPGDNVSFANATEDYDVKNKIGEEFHERKGGDAMKQMGNTNNNNVLRFKCQQYGKNGSIQIFFWYWY